MITYQIENFKECLEELEPLFKECFNEIEYDNKLVSFNPDYKTYIKVEEIGLLSLITVRDNSILVGYFIAIITPMLHSKHLTSAHNDTLYIKPSHRKGTIGYRLLKFVEKHLIDRGVNIFTISMKVEHPFDRLCERLGMIQIERNYLKYLGD